MFRFDVNTISDGWITCWLHILDLGISIVQVIYTRIIQIHLYFIFRKMSFKVFVDIFRLWNYDLVDNEFSLR